MKRLLGAVVAMLSLVGCCAPAPPNDPFLYRSTIPPPGTITPGVAPAGQPYYPAPHWRHSGTANDFAGRSGLASRAARTDGCAGYTRGACSRAEQIRASRRIQLSKFTPVPGGNPSASIHAATLASQISTDPAVVTAANWQVPKTDRADSPILTPIAAQPRPEPSVVRIVEPAKTTSSAAASDSPPRASTNDSAVTPTAPAVAAPSPSPPDSAPPPPVTISTATATSASTAMEKTADPPAVPEITDFPAVASGGVSSLKPAAVESTPVKFRPSDRGPATATIQTTKRSAASSNTRSPVAGGS